MSKFGFQTRYKSKCYSYCEKN